MRAAVGASSGDGVRAAERGSSGGGVRAAERGTYSSRAAERGSSGGQCEGSREVLLGGTVFEAFKRGISW